MAKIKLPEFLSPLQQLLDHLKLTILNYNCAKESVTIGLDFSKAHLTVVPAGAHLLSVDFQRGVGIFLFDVETSVEYAKRVLKIESKEENGQLEELGSAYEELKDILNGITVLPQEEQKMVTAFQLLRKMRDIGATSLTTV